MPEASGSRYAPYPSSLNYNQQQQRPSPQQQHQQNQRTFSPPPENNNNSKNGTLINSPGKNGKGSELIGGGEKKDKVRRGSKACIGVSFLN